jgi:chromosome segregation ATPase
MANEYANTIEGLEVTITNLRAQITEYTTNLAAEREQREQTETALDTANEEIESLNDRIHNNGLQANELRSKLFQLQQEKEKAIAQLEEDAQEREDDLTEQLTTQTGLRDTAEKTVAKLGTQIEQLEADLETANIDLINMEEARQLLEKDREQQVVNLNQQLTDLKVKYTALETSTTSTITSLQANITDLNNQVHRQQAEIKRLTEESVAKDVLYVQDTTVLGGEIVELKEELAEERAENKAKGKEIASLSQRVEEEATELLNLTNLQAQESTSLKSAISTHESTIRTLQATAAQRAEEYEEMLMERTREIEELQMLGTARVETITMMQSQIADLKERFAKQEEDTRLTVDALNLAHRRLMEENETLAAALKKRNADTLKAVQEMKTANVVVKSRHTDLGKVQNGKIVKTTEKVKVGKKGRKVAARSWRDSGMFDESSPSKVDGEDEEIADDFLAA